MNGLSNLDRIYLNIVIWFSLWVVILLPGHKIWSSILLSLDTLCHFLEPSWLWSRMSQFCWQTFWSWSWSWTSRSFSCAFWFWSWSWTNVCFGRRPSVLGLNLLVCFLQPSSFIPKHLGLDLLALSGLWGCNTPRFICRFQRYINRLLIYFFTYLLP